MAGRQLVFVLLSHGTMTVQVQYCVVRMYTVLYCLCGLAGSGVHIHSVALRHPTKYCPTLPAQQSPSSSAKILSTEYPATRHLSFETMEGEYKQPW